MKRVISEHEERVYRLCHHEFGGMTVAEAAKKLGMGMTHVRAVLRRLKHKAPQLFPILTKKQWNIYKLYTEHGMTQDEISVLYKTCQSNIHGVLKRMKEKGMPGIELEGVGDTVVYTPGMDKYIKRRF